jgi:hypothetical protein
MKAPRMHLCAVLSAKETCIVVEVDELHATYRARAKASINGLFAMETLAEDDAMLRVNTLVKWIGQVLKLQAEFWRI